MTQTIKRQTKADVSLTPHVMGIPVFIRSSPQTIIKPHQNRTKTHPHKHTQKVKTKNQQPKTGRKNSAFSHEPNYKKPAILSGQNSEKNNNATF